MARTYSIAQVVQSGTPGTPGRIRLNSAVGDVTSAFAGKFYRNSAGLTRAFYDGPAAGYALIIATTFDIIDNSSYAGRYTVYTPTSAGDLAVNPSSKFTTFTEIAVNEVIAAPTTAGDDVNTGSVTNISTYVLPITGETNLVLPPTVDLTSRPLELLGRNGLAWGEAYSQNFIKLAQNFAGASAPTLPYLGQTWFDTSTSTLNVRKTSSWSEVATRYRYVNGGASTMWTINHNLNLPAPYVCAVHVAVDVGGGVHEGAIPLNIFYDTANSLRVEFSTPQDGIALLFV